MEGRTIDAGYLLQELLQRLNSYEMALAYAASKGDMTTTREMEASARSLRYMVKLFFREDEYEVLERPLAGTETRYRIYKSKLRKEEENG